MSLKNPYETLLRISEEMNLTHDISLLLDRIMDYAMEALSAERGFILLKNQGKGNYVVVTARNISNDSISTIRSHSSSIVNKVLETGEAILSLDARADERFAGAESIVVQQIKSVICTPLVFDGQILAAIYMDSTASVRQFDRESLEFLKAFAKQATVALNNARLFEQLMSENQKLKRQVSIRQQFPNIIGKSEPIIHILETIRDVADSTASVLIEGESGTGKELVARALHNLSSRKTKPFIPLFCGSLAENLLESELFGHRKGAFTGATENKRGLFEEADRGTLFLDEIAEVSLAMQTKLLRFLQEGEFKRVGDTQIRTADVRIVSATNKDLLKEVEKGNFREDLYYRLNVINIKMPALRERRSDIPLLAEHFLKLYASRNKKTVKGFTPGAIRKLQEYDWPGNVRELENAVERAVILTRKPEIDEELFQFRRTTNSIPLGKTLKEINRYAVLETIKMLNGNRTKAAEVLGVSRRWLQYQLKEWGMVNEN